MSLALAFMATSMTPLVIPARNAVADRIPSEGAKPIAAIAAAKAKPPTSDANPLRKRCASRPVSGIATIPPAAKARSAKLSPASESARSALIRGIAAAHAPIPRPFAKKTLSVPSR
jgi:hypothetical protein